MEINQITEKIIDAAIEIHKAHFNVPVLRDGIKRIANRL